MLPKDDENDDDNNGVADVEEEPDLPVGVAVESLRKVFTVLFQLR